MQGGRVDKWPPNVCNKVPIKYLHPGYPLAWGMQGTSKKGPCQEGGVCKHGGRGKGQMRGAKEGQKTTHVPQGWPDSLRTHLISRNAQQMADGHAIFWEPPSRATLGDHNKNMCNVQKNDDHMSLWCGGKNVSFTKVTIQAT